MAYDPKRRSLVFLLIGATALSLPLATPARAGDDRDDERGRWRERGRWKPQRSRRREDDNDDERRRFVRPWEDDDDRRRFLERRFFRRRERDGDD